jgi:PHP family Zn ribbon phosphoesterase
MFADLHIHTWHSDGTQSPEEVVSIAKARGLSVISICDHDTVDAYDSLRKACAENKILLIQGVELDVYLGEKRLHMLAYHFDPVHPDMRVMIQKSRRELDEISVDMVAEMEKDFPRLSSADYALYIPPKGRGGWKGINYLFDRGLSENVMDARRYHKRYGHYRPAFYALADACRCWRTRA